MNNTQRNQIRTEIAGKIRALRIDRHWTQAELSKRLGLSQGRFSEIERGQGSFTAEQFLEVLKLFNVPVSHFAGSQDGAGFEVQNALARLGAGHLQKRPDVLPSERLEETGDVVREALLGAVSPGQVTALAPVLVCNIDRVNLNKLRAQFLAYGLERRLAWLIENTLVAVRHELSGGPPHTASILYRRADLILSAYLGNAPSSRPQRKPDEAPDLLDARILDEQKLDEVQNSMSAISRRWGVATALQPGDFIEALKASRAADPGPPERPERHSAEASAGKAPPSVPRPSRPDAPGKKQKRNEGYGKLNQIEMDWD